MTHPPPDEPDCAHFCSVLIPGKPGSYQSYPDEFIYIFREFRTYPGFLSDNSHEKRLKLILFGKRSLI